jgi:DNA polymerase I-like protein with 3'-5' exonuclease and polymerase domains
MILKVDASALEWRCAVELSQDQTGIQEIINGVDAHSDNQKRFNLPTRLIAKTYLFRLIYGGSSFAYANDPQFMVVSKNEKFWQKVIDETYNKYKGLAKWHTGIVQEVTLKGKLMTPTGRIYKYEPEIKRGELTFPRTKILNYPVQGFAADLIQIARVSAWRRLRDKAIFFSTVHDDLELDLPNDPQLCYDVSVELEKVFTDIPENVKKIYGYEMKVPLAGEVSFGYNLGDMKDFDKTLGKVQFVLT